MQKRYYIETDKQTSYLAETLLAKMNEQGLDLKQLLELVRMLTPSREPERFYGREKTAEILDISVEQLDILRKNGKIGFRKIERSIKYSKKDIQEFQENSKVRYEPE